MLVSVIIPVYNDFDDLLLAIKALKNQSYPSDNIEIIVVDNNSSNDIKEKLKKYTECAQCIFLNEDSYLMSPYSARNRGIEISKGEVIAFLDSTCIPSKFWIQNALNAFESSNADLIGGDVKFRFSSKPTIGEIADSLKNIQMEKSIKERGTAKTANLFVKKDVIYKIGKFPEGIRSGGDVLWTKKATKSGFKLIFDSGTLVYKKARCSTEFLKKEWRINKGVVAIAIQENKLMIVLLKSLLRIIIPPYKLLNQVDYRLKDKTLVFVFLWFSRFVSTSSVIWHALSKWYENKHALSKWYENEISV